MVRGSGSAPLLALFALEALGQCLLARNGTRSAASRDLEVVYFRRNALGSAAVVVFALVSWMRFVLADVALAADGTLATLGALGCTGIAAAVLSFSRVRADITMGTMIAASAVFLGVSSLFAGVPGAAGTQFAYAAVLAFGVLVLRPWQAELLNIPVFASAALWPPFG